MWTKSLAFPLVVALIVGLSILFLFGCANQTVASGPCQELDWYELGRADGAKGLVAGSPRTVKPICPQTSVAQSEALYENGYNSTISNFCTYHQGFAAGLTNEQKNVNRCPNLLRKFYLKGFASGRRYAQLQQSKRLISTRIRSLNTYLSDKSIALPRRAILHGQKIQLEQKIQMVRRDIASIQKERALN